MSRSDRLVPILLAIAGAMFAAAPFVIDTAPDESTMGLVQRIFYFHFPSAMSMLISALICGVASAMFLFRRDPRADRVAVSAAELTVVFGIMTLVTGPLWGRKAWGVYWAWDARITSTFVMWMVFNAYLLLRRFGGAGSEVLAAAVGLFGMVLVPFIRWSVDLWRTLHPSTSVLPNLPVSMGIPLYFCWAAFTVLLVALLLIRMRLERQRAWLDDAYLSVED
ncbi:MAG TPA: cytochrome c biogenesis protein CcsA [Vicinamibacterales bacterium]|jgi:heme exporter protein C|nr:cytochrome c biogenesis protein CcsA [Vicinamibacterales bacterium]